jgi:hypothetical protein
MDPQLEARLRDTADRAREAETAIRIARHSVGPASPALPALSARYTAALADAVAATQALITSAGDAGCPFCAEGCR